MKKLLSVIIILVVLTAFVPQISVNADTNNLLIEIIGYDINNVQLISNPGNPIAIAVKITNIGDDPISWNSYPTEVISWITNLTNSGLLNPGEYIEFNITANPAHLGNLAVQWIVNDGVENTVIFLNYHVYPPPTIVAHFVNGLDVIFFGEFLLLPINIPLSSYTIVLKDPSGDPIFSTTCEDPGVTCSFDQVTIGRPESYIGSVIFSGPHGETEYFLNEIPQKVFLPLIFK